MRAIIPLAGFGTRMRPHTWSKPKPLLNVAGKPVLGHVLDALAPLELDEVVFIVGWLGEQIRDFVGQRYPFQARYVRQDELRGQAHALYLAREYLDGPCLILFVDTLFEADLSGLAKRQEDGVLFVKEVDDPRRFGVAVEEDGRVVRLVEKPSSLEHRNAVIGLYYVRQAADLVGAIEHLLDEDIQTKGEYYLADALQVMIDRGATMVTAPVDAWLDCGEPPTMLETNRYLLEHGHARPGQGEHAAFVPPVYVHPTAEIREAVVGPHVTVNEGVRIVRSVVRDSIIEAGTHIEGAHIEGALIGRNATITGRAWRLNVGDDDVLRLNG